MSDHFRNELRGPNDHTGYWQKVFYMCIVKRADLKGPIPDHFGMLNGEQMSEVYEEINKHGDIEQKDNGPVTPDLQPFFVQDRCKHCINLNIFQ